MVGKLVPWLRSAALDPSPEPLSLSSNIVRMLLLLGIGERAAWNLFRPNRGAGGEAYDVARAIGDGRGIADAFGPGTGTTAHLLPVSPGIGGAVYAAFGTGSRLAEVVLASWSIATCFAGYLVLDRVFARLGLPRGTRLAGFAYLCLAPTYLPQEAVDFRVWEGALSVLLLALLLDRIGAADGQPPAVRRDLPTIVLAALLFFTNPLVGIAGAAGLGMYWLRNCTIGAIALRAGLYAAAVAALVTPWTVRNERVMGTPILLRSNFGLELAIGEYPGELARGDGAPRFMARLKQVHPRQSSEALAAMHAAGGEVRYARLMKEDTLGWIRAHPGTALEIAALHLGQIVAPPPWSFRLWNPPPLAPVRSALASLAGVLGFAGLLAGLARRPREWTYVGLAVLIPMALFAPFQPVMRYTYLFYGIFSYCAADMALRLGQRVRRREDRPVAGAAFS